MERLLTSTLTERTLSVNADDTNAMRLLLSDAQKEPTMVRVPSGDGNSRTASVARSMCGLDGVVWHVAERTDVGSVPISERSTLTV